MFSNVSTLESLFKKLSIHWQKRCLSVDGKIEIREKDVFSKKNINLNRALAAGADICLKG